MSTQGSLLLRAKHAALVALATREAEEHKDTLRDLDAFEERLDACLTARPRLADAGRRSLPWTLPNQERVAAVDDDTSRALSQAFARIDSNGDGVLSRAEVIKACRHDEETRVLLGLPAKIRQEDGTRDAFEEIFQWLDGDMSKQIDFAEFCAAFSGPAERRAPAAAPQPKLALTNQSQ